MATNTGALQLATLIHSDAIANEYSVAFQPLTQHLPSCFGLCSESQEMFCERLHGNLESQTEWLKIYHVNASE